MIPISGIDDLLHKNRGLIRKIRHLGIEVEAKIALQQENDKLRDELIGARNWVYTLSEKLSTLSKEKDTCDELLERMINVFKKNNESDGEESKQSTREKTHQEKFIQFQKEKTLMERDYKEALERANAATMEARIEIDKLMQEKLYLKEYTTCNIRTKSSSEL
eukprot:TRINITY_DN8402_c0_g1_i1.p1 TRINITY_DN8402_c0_g1~~TRINITY_DN8402_c0_g1_i1.p1  ORF type:complete len:163 (+),score=30.14 TRINITY_DN8402_c0_g1_i1:272-760(+)